MITAWEAQHKCCVTDKANKRGTLAKVVRACGLSTSQGVSKLRRILQSLKRCKLPINDTEVDRHLKQFGEQTNGPGRRSFQQRRLVLLHLLDPDLKGDLGEKVLETGGYQWHDGMQQGLTQAIAKHLSKWVTKYPPHGYKISTFDLWTTRRAHGMQWATSNVGLQFAKSAYKKYAEIFESVTKGQSRNTFGKCLEKFYLLRRQQEEGDLRLLLKALLTGLCSACECTDINVVDCFSFMTRELNRSIFNFFATKVRKNPGIATAIKRKKDREDAAKTYYICGVVWKSLHTQSKSKTNGKVLLQALDSLTITAHEAKKMGLPCRHVVLKNRGGLVFASYNYYQLMCEVEDRFYCTVC